jgi:hypothetical protein
LQAETKAMGQRISRQAVQEAFARFDANGDGVVCLQELKDGIRDILRKELVAEEHVQTVMKHFDASGDGVLQPEEFVTLDKLRTRLEDVMREEERQLTIEQRQRQPQPGLLKSFLAAFRLPDEQACETNLDCDQPQVCCDFHFKKFCCSSGLMARQLQLQYATVPVPQQH